MNLNINSKYARMSDYFWMNVSDRIHCTGWHTLARNFELRPEFGMFDFSVTPDAISAGDSIKGSVYVGYKPTGIGLNREFSFNRRF